MAKRKTRGNTRGRQKEEEARPYKAFWEPKGTQPETVKDIFALIFIFIGFMLVLSYFGAAGSLGESLFSAVKNAFGLTSYLFGPALFGVAWLVFKRKEIRFDLMTFGGLAVAGVAISGLFEILFEAKGGLIGNTVTLLLLNFLSAPLVFGLLLILAAAGLLFGFNVSIKSLFEKKPEGELESEGISLNFRKNFKLPKLFTKKKEDVVPVTVSKASNPKNWEPYPLDLLEAESGSPATADLSKQSSIIKETLANFGIDVSMGEISVGPSVTQFSLKPDEGVKLNQITALNNDLSLALAAHPIRIEAPIPGKSLVGIEVPNKTRALVRLKPLLDAKEVRKFGSNLAFPLGRKVDGSAYSADLKNMPHLLIAGTTGSGKSVALNSLLLSLLYKNSKETLRLILVDPKRVEMTAYAGVPHLLTPVIVDPQEIISALKWSTEEMDRRLKEFAGVGARNIEEYHTRKKEEMPYIVIVIDELAQLMQIAQKDVESLIVRIAQMARATGIHLIVATQRPEVKVVTGLIKANITSRVAFAFGSNVDSRTILDMGGAEKLLGKGDMLYTSSELSAPVRIQGPYVSEAEIEAVTGYLKRDAIPEYNADVVSRPVHLRGSSIFAEEHIDDELYEQAKGLVLRARKASASLLQRHLRVGYARAARLLDMLEEQGVVGPGEGAKPRAVLAEEVETLDGERI